MTGTPNNAITNNSLDLKVHPTIRRVGRGRVREDRIYRLVG